MNRLFLKRSIGDSLVLHMENGDRATITVVRIKPGVNGGVPWAHLLIEAPRSVGVVMEKEDGDEDSEP